LPTNKKKDKLYNIANEQLMNSDTYFCFVCLFVCLFVCYQYQSIFPSFSIDNILQVLDDNRTQESLEHRLECKHSAQQRMLYKGLTSVSSASNDIYMRNRYMKERSVLPEVG